MSDREVAKETIFAFDDVIDVAVAVVDAVDVNAAVDAVGFVSIRMPPSISF